MLVCAVCRARAGLVKQRDCGIECSCLSQYVGRGNSIWFGLAGFSFYEVWSDCSVLVAFYLIVSVRAGLAGFVLSWCGRLGITGQA